MYGITVLRDIGEAKVTFTATLTTADEALSIATYFAGAAAGKAPAAAKTQQAATEKKSDAAKDTAAAPTPDKQTLTASDSSASSSNGSTSGASTEAKKDEAAPVLDYEKDIKPLVLAIAKISREKAEALLQRFGVASAKALKPDQFADFKATADQVIAGTYDPVASDEEAIA